MSETSLRIQKTLSWNTCLSVALAVLTGSELFLARNVFNFFAFYVNSLIAFLNPNILNSDGYKRYYFCLNASNWWA